MKKRSAQAEQLDNLSLKGKELTQALKSLAWVNQWFGNHQVIIRSVLKIIRQHSEHQLFRIIDLGCGGGDVLFKLAQTLQRKGIQFSMTGVDGNQHALDFAAERCKSFPQINYLQGDILAEDYQLPTCDILISSHFLYHFKAEALHRFLQRNLPQVQVAFINSGLERNPWASRLFSGLAFLLPISKMAKEDGLLAIRRAFTKSELLAILKPITAQKIELRRLPFFRLRLFVLPAH